MNARGIPPATYQVLAILLYLIGGYPIQSWWGSTPSSYDGGGYPGVPPGPGMGYPPVQTWDGVPPVQTWDGVLPTQTWDRVPPPRPGIGYPPFKVWTDKQTENSTFPHPSDAGGKNSRFIELTKTSFVDPSRVLWKWITTVWMPNPNLLQSHNV